MDAQPPASPPPAIVAPASALRWRNLLGFAAPVFPFAGQEVAFKVFLPLYLAQSTRFSIGVIATLFLVFRIWDTASGPIVGWVSDRWRFGHRRFVPMVLGTPLALIGVALVLLAPQGLPPVAMMGVLIVTALGWTMVNVPHGAWALELAPDPVPRTRVFAARQMLGLIALPLFALGPSLLEHLYGANSRRDATILAVMMIVTLPASLLWLWAVIPRRLRRVAPPRPKITLADLSAAFADRQSLFLVLLFVCLGVHQEMRDGLILFWVQGSLRLPNWSWSILLLQAVFGAASVPLWVRMQARLGALPALRRSLVASAALSLGFIIVPAGSVAALVGFMIAQGAVAGAAFMLLRTLLGDHFDRLVARRGVNLAGTLYSGFHLAYNLAVALTLPVALELLATLGFRLRAVRSIASPIFDPLAWVIGCGGCLPLLLAILLVARRQRRSQP